MGRRRAERTLTVPAPVMPITDTREPFRGKAPLGRHAQVHMITQEPRHDVHIPICNTSRNGRQLFYHKTTITITTRNITDIIIIMAAAVRRLINAHFVFPSRLRRV